jgi:hypothetical protein
LFTVFWKPVSARTGAQCTAWREESPRIAMYPTVLAGTDAAQCWEGHSVHRVHRFDHQGSQIRSRQSISRRGHNRANGAATWCALSLSVRWR